MGEKKKGGWGERKKKKGKKGGREETARGNSSKGRMAHDTMSGHKAGCKWTRAIFLTSGILLPLVPLQLQASPLQHPTPDTHRPHPLPSFLYEVTYFQDFLFINTTPPLPIFFHLSQNHTVNADVILIRVLERWFSISCRTVQTKPAVARKKAAEVKTDREESGRAKATRKPHKATP